MLGALALPLCVFRSEFPPRLRWVDSDPMVTSPTSVERDTYLEALPDSPT